MCMHTVNIQDAVILIHLSDHLEVLDLGYQAFTRSATRGALWPPHEGL